LVLAGAPGAAIGRLGGFRCPSESKKHCPLFDYSCYLMLGRWLPTTAGAEGPFEHHRFPQVPLVLELPEENRRGA